MKTNTYPRAEKLKSEKEISLLLKKGKWRSVGDIRILFLRKDPNEKTKIGVSVSKRYFKKAVDRNRVKRLLREAYRLHKTEFKNAFNAPISAMIFWVSPNKPKHYNEVEEQFLQLIKTISSQ